MRASTCQAARPSSVARNVALLCLLLPVGAQATNGYFLHGYGAKAKGMGGAGAAFSQDAIAAATNPAGIVNVPERFDFGVDFFMPRRGASITGNFFGPDRDYDGNGEKLYYIPDVGYVRARGNWSAGFAMYGNGGMNTTYRDNPFARFGSDGDGGVDLVQLYVVPTLAYKITEAHSVGLSLNIVHQRFEATGLQAFASRAFPGPYSADPDNVSNKGYDDSSGIGGRIGYQGRFFDRFSLGASWQPKIKMGRFDKYQGLFAERGGFDIPGNYTVGAAWAPLSALTIAFDYQRIEYSRIPSVANPIANLQNPESPDAQLINQLPAEGAGSLNEILRGLNAGQGMLAVVDALTDSPLGPALISASGPLSEGRYGGKLGADNGPGFGWRDMNVYKLGVNYRVNPLLEVRAGFSDNTQPIPQDQTFFNILAPGVVRKHYTAGATLSIRSHEITVSYLDAPEVVVRGHNSIPSAPLPLPPESFGGGEADIRLKERAIGLSYGYRF